MRVSWLQRKLSFFLSFSAFGDGDGDGIDEGPRLWTWRRCMHACSHEEGDSAGSGGGLCHPEGATGREDQQHLHVSATSSEPFSASNHSLNGMESRKLHA